VPEQSCSHLSGRGERARGKGKGEDKEVAQMRSSIAVVRG